MRIGIDISQIAFEGTGVSRYVRNLVSCLVQTYPRHTFVLFGASLRKRAVFMSFLQSLGAAKNVQLVTVPIPPTLLEMLWNRLGFPPVEWFTGKLDIFWSSDWTQPNTRAVSVTTIHDLSIMRFAEESHNKTTLRTDTGTVSPNIVSVQMRRLKRAARMCSAFFCDSEATKNDAITLLGIAPEKLYVVYPGWEGAV